MDVKGWCDRIERWVRDETELSNTFMLEEPVLQNYLQSRKYCIMHPRRKDSRGNVKIDKAKFLIRKL